MHDEYWLARYGPVHHMKSPSLPTRSPTQRAATRCFSRFVEAKFALVFHAFSRVPHAHRLPSHPSNSSPNCLQAYNQARHQSRQQLSESSRCILNDCFPDLTASLLDNTVPQNLGEVGLRMMKHNPIAYWSGQKKTCKKYACRSTFLSKTSCKLRMLPPVKNAKYDYLLHGDQIQIKDCGSSMPRYGRVSHRFEQYTGKQAYGIAIPWARLQLASAQHCWLECDELVRSVGS